MYYKETIIYGHGKTNLPHINIIDPSLCIIYDDSCLVYYNGQLISLI